MKICKRCHSRPVTKKNKKNKDGLQSYCNVCAGELTKAWKNKNGARVKATRKEWYAKNKTYALSAAKAFSLLFRYGITPEDYQRMMDEQGGVCKICKKPPTGRFSLSVDHDHATNRIRGLLCGKCNFALGHANDDPQLLRSMAKYLEEQ